MTELAHVVTPAQTAQPTGAVVLLHGRGADEHGLGPFLAALDPGHALVHVTPGGPLHLAPGGRHWYVVPRVGYPDPETFRASYLLLDEFLRALPDRIGVPWERTVLGGFSQGGVMSYALGLGDATGELPARPAPAGILAMSCFMPTVPGFEHQLDGRAGFPVMITHGSLDPVISVDFGRAARDTMTAAGAAVEYRESPMAHTIDPRVVPDVQRWLLDRAGA